MIWSSRKKKRGIFVPFILSEVKYFLRFVFYLNVCFIEYIFRIYTFLHIKKHYFIYFCCLFLKLCFFSTPVPDILSWKIAVAFFPYLGIVKLNLKIDVYHSKGLNTLSNDVSCEEKKTWIQIQHKGKLWQNVLNIYKYVIKSKSIIL